MSGSHEVFVAGADVWSIGTPQADEHCAERRRIQDEGVAAGAEAKRFSPRVRDR
jgi:hypothetical protein